MKITKEEKALSYAKKIAKKNENKYYNKGMLKKRIKNSSLLSNIKNVEEDGLINLKSIDLFNIQNYVIRTNESNSILSGILYASYNSILLIPVLITLKDYLKDKKQIKIISILTTFIILLLAIILFLLLIKVDVDITKLEMPIVYVVSNMFRGLKTVYGFIILGSILTTSISLGTSFLQNTSKNKKSYTQIAIIMCITSVLVSQIGFSNLINLLYPIFGYLGLIQIGGLILKKQKHNS